MTDATLSSLTVESTLPAGLELLASLGAPGAKQFVAVQPAVFDVAGAAAAAQTAAQAASDPAGSAATAQTAAIAAAATATGSAVAAALPMASTSQLYGGSGAAGTARPIVLGTGLSMTGNTLNAATGSGSSTTPVTTVATSGAAQALAFPSSGNTAYDITLSANCTLTLTGGTAGQLQTVTLYLRQNSTAGWTPGLPAGIRWPGGIAPVPNTTAGKIDVFTFSTPDGGATIFGSY